MIGCATKHDLSLTRFFDLKLNLTIKDSSLSGEQHDSLPDIPGVGHLETDYASHSYTIIFVW